MLGARSHVKAFNIRFRVSLLPDQRQLLSTSAASFQPRDPLRQIIRQNLSWCANGCYCVRVFGDPTIDLRQENWDNIKNSLFARWHIIATYDLRSPFIMPKYSRDFRAQPRV